MRIFFESLLAYISHRVIFFTFEMCPPLSGGYLQSKLGTIQIRYKRVHVRIETMLFLSIYSWLCIPRPLAFLGHTTCFVKHFCFNCMDGRFILLQQVEQWYIVIVNKPTTLLTLVHKLSVGNLHTP